MTFPLTERQADQLVVESLRAVNLEAANAAGPAVMSEYVQELETIRAELVVEECGGCAPPVYVL